MCNWIFNVSVSKVIDGYGEDRRFKVLKGKGYGIIDDCGGSWELYQILEGNDKSWGEYDINDFDIDQINKKIDFVF